MHWYDCKEIHKVPFHHSLFEILITKLLYLTCAHEFCSIFVIKLLI